MTEVTMIEEPEPTSVDLILPRPCPHCGNVVNGKAKLVEIEHFKEVAHLIIDCDNCGKQSESFKSGHRVEEKGTKTTLRLENKRDFERKILKSETCTLEIPSLGLELPPETLPGKFMPVSDFLHQTLTDILRHASSAGQSGTPEFRKWIQSFIAFMDGQSLPATLTLDDPAGNTYLESFSAPQIDSNIQMESYERDAATNAKLGV